LQQLVWVFKKISQLVALRSEYFRSQVGGYLDSCHRGIFLHVANFIYLDARLPRQRGFQLFRQRRRLGIPARKRADESRELRLRQPRRKVNARDARRNQQLREASFARRRAQRHAVQQNLRSRSAQQHTTPAAVIQRVAQFVPRRFELVRRSNVAKLIQPRELQQDVQAADKRPRPASRFRTHTCWPG
jgi:hypothetical protein